MLASRRWTGFESRPFCSEGPPRWPLRGPSEPPAVDRWDRVGRLHPWSASVSMDLAGFESRPQRSTRCQNHNVWPGRSWFRVSDRSTYFVSSFKPWRGCLRGSAARPGRVVNRSASPSQPLEEIQGISKAPAAVQTRRPRLPGRSTDPAQKSELCTPRFKCSHQRDVLPVFVSAPCID